MHNNTGKINWKVLNTPKYSSIKDFSINTRVSNLIIAANKYNVNVDQIAKILGELGMNIEEWQLIRLCSNMNIKLHKDH